MKALRSLRETYRNPQALPFWGEVGVKLSQCLFYYLLGYFIAAVLHGFHKPKSEPDYGFLIGLSSAVIIGTIYRAWSQRKKKQYLLAGLQGTSKDQAV